MSFNKTLKLLKQKTQKKTYKKKVLKGGDDARLKDFKNIIPVQNNNIEIYYNCYDKNDNDTDYVKMIEADKYKCALFIYTSYNENSGPGHSYYGGGGTALISKNKRAFGIITGRNKDDGIKNKYKVNYKKVNGFNKYPKKDEKKIILDHIDDQINMLYEYILFYNSSVITQENDKITSIIIPTEQNGKTLGVNIFAQYDDIKKIGTYIINALKHKFNKTDNFKNSKTIKCMSTPPAQPAAQPAPPAPPAPPVQPVQHQPDEQHDKHPATPKKNLKAIQKLSGSYLTNNALETGDLRTTISFFNEIMDENSNYKKLIRNYLPKKEADDYIDKINSVDKSKEYSEIIKEFIPLLNKLQIRLFTEFKKKHNKYLKQNTLFGKNYNDMIRTQLDEDNPIIDLGDETKTYEELLNTIDITGSPVNINIHNGFYINNLKNTYKQVTDAAYVAKINNINTYLLKTLF
jgi:hypothetical protein